MDVTTLALAVDSTQVNSAAAALDKMAVSGGKAETASTRLSKATADQGRALTALTPAANKGALAFKTLAEAQAALGPAAAAQLAAAGAFGAVEAQATGAAAAVHRLGEESQIAAAKTKAALAGVTGSPASVLPTVAQTVPQAARTPVVAPVGSGAAIAGARAVVAANESIAKSAKLAAFQQQQLGFQLNDFGVQVFSGQSPLTALVQQGSQLAGTFGGVGNAFKAVAALITPVRVALGGILGVVAGIGFAFVEGARQSREFAEALQLSGGFAGQTEASFKELTRTVADRTKSTAANVRELAQELLRTGEIGPQVFGQAAEATVGYANATGKSAQEVARDFALMARSPTKFAQEANRQLNFLTAAQYASIKAFEDQGRAADAQGVIFDALIQRFPRINQNLGLIEATLAKGKSLWAGFWDAAYDIGRTQTLDEKIADVRSRLAALPPPRGNPALPGNASNTAVREADKAELADLQRRQFRESENATATALRGEVQKQAITADAVVDSYVKRGKAASAYAEKLAELNRSFDAKEAAGVPVSPADKKVALTQLKKDFTNTSGNSKAQELLDAQLDQKIKASKDVLEQERDTIAFQQRFLQGEYQAGRQSLVDFYDGKRDAIQQGVAAELAELDKERAAVRSHLAATKALNPGDKSATVKDETKLNEIDAQSEKLRVALGREVILSDQQKGEALRQLNEQVLNYRANLLQLQGDEVGAAKLRAQSVIEQASVLSKQALPAPTAGSFARQDRGQAPEKSPVDVAGLQRALDQQTALKDAKDKTSDANQRLAIEEERIALAQRTGSISEFEALRRVTQERAKIIPQLEKEVQKQEEIAAQLQNKDNWQLQIDTSRARLELEKLKADLDPLAEKFRTMFSDAGGNLIADVLNDPKNAKQAAKKFFSSITSQLNADIGRNLSTQLFSKEGLLGKLPSSFGDLFAGTKGAKQDKPLVDTSGVTSSLTSFQTTGLQPATSALGQFTQALQTAAGAVGKEEAKAAEPVTTGDFARLDRGQESVASPTTGDFARADRGQTDTGERQVLELFKDAKRGSDAFGLSANDAAGAVLHLAGSASRGNEALAALPAIIRLIQAAASSSSGGGGSAIASGASSLFGGGSGAASSSASEFGTGAAFGSEDIGLFLSSGGYTGDADTKKATGIVHGKEFVFSAPAVKAIGRDTLEAVHAAAAHGKLEDATKSKDRKQTGAASMESSAASPWAGSDTERALYFHSGGMVGTTSDKRPVPDGAFDHAPRYHDGGIVGQVSRPVPGVFADVGRYHAGGMVKPDEKMRAAGGLKPNEVPAVLMGGPKGTREEVLKANDPRHTDNLSPRLRTVIDKMPRYHEGGIVGMPSYMAASSTTVSAQSSSASPDDKAGSQRPMNLTVNVTAVPGMSRATALQQGAAIGEGTQRAYRRGA